MKLAVNMGSHPDIASPGDVAREAEMRGFDAIFFPEHTHVPLSDTHEIPYADMEHRLDHRPRYYSPFIAMAWAASATTRLKIGTSVGLPGQYDPIILAKMLSSLDAMSDGRLVYGFGFGWAQQEMIDHGMDPKRRRATVREKMLAVQLLLIEDSPSFSGEFVNFPPCRFGPKPPDPRRIKCLLGAQGTDQVFDHVIEYCDGWVPAQYGEVAPMLGQIAHLRARAAHAGRDPETIQVDITTPEPSAEKFAALSEVGVERVILSLPFAGIDEVRRALDAMVKDYMETGVVVSAGA